MSTEIEAMQKAQATPLEYMAFSGGGAKGAIYSGAYLALKEAGIFNGIKAVAGSSAGAITAALVATGITPKKFEEISKNTNLQSLLGRKGFSAPPVHVSKDAKPLYDLLDNTIRENITSFLQRDDIKSISDQKLNELRERCKNKDKIYFKDLVLLCTYDPTEFKDLVITAVRQEDGELTIFDSFNTPDVEIALACKASASIPGVFESTKIEGDLYVDGGYRDNTPTKYFQENQPEFEVKDVTEDMEEISLAKKQGRTLAMAFGSGMEAEANIAVYSAQKLRSPNEIVKFLMDVLFKMLVGVGGKFKYTDTLRATSEELRENALNTVALNTQGIGTLDFKDAQKYADYLHTKGYCQTREYLNNHELGEAADKTFEHQSFLLNIYEIYNNKNLNKTFGMKLLDSLIAKDNQTDSKWRSGVIENHDDKAKMLLSFCDVNALREKELGAMLEEYVLVAAAARNNTLNADTNGIKALMSGLNTNTATNEVKESFIKLLSIDPNQDNRFDKNKLYSENIIKFKFSKEDFALFLKQNKSEAIKMQNKFNVNISRGG
jgi:NTE family protein